ncbi:hypothetical protein SSBR45G_27920 [Bradyrhizobium sp. SSBR45G]|nr:hypothetical protein SSBR45G_27920 [Bradyrhizobium sp. SSBR45G]GLH85495.1 hypothetical protein SSBR45R_29550 [Bradyrhizobium sp. SSBR45R]
MNHGLGTDRDTATAVRRTIVLKSMLPSVRSASKDLQQFPRPSIGFDVAGATAAHPGTSYAPVA